MKIFVITKKMLIIAAAVIFVVAAAVIIALSFSDGAVSPTSAMAQLEEYELEVLAGKKKELPVYSVERSDMKIAIYGGVICAKQPKQKRRYYAGAVFTSCTMEQHSSPFGISGAYYSAYAYGSVFRKNYAAVYLPHPFACALLTAVVTGKYIVHLIFKSTFALGEFPASAFRNLNMNIVRAGKSGIWMETAFVFAAHIENRAELTKSRSIAYTPQCA